MEAFRNKTLGQIVTEDHRAATLMAKYRLDFCCKGKRTLETACDEQHISVEELMKELEALSVTQDTGTSFENMSNSELISHILVKHHLYVKTESPQLLYFLQKIASKHGERHPELIGLQETFATLKNELEEHMEKEETILFPRLKEMTKESYPPIPGNFLAGPIQVMEAEHEAAGRLMEEIRRLTNDYTPPEDACTTYRVAFQGLEAYEKDLHQHVHLENNILFPRAQVQA